MVDPRFPGRTSIRAHLFAGIEIKGQRSSTGSRPPWPESVRIDELRGSPSHT